MVKTKADEQFDITAKLSTMRVSSRKVVAVARFLRSKTVDEAIDYLNYSPKKASGFILGAVKSAANNGSQKYQIDQKDLYVKDVMIGPGPTKGWRRFAAKGRFKPIRRRTTNIKIVLDKVVKEESAK